jgi:peptidoglycan hydrolase-like protein with peptidoglycan-binding domain
MYRKGLTFTTALITALFIIFQSVSVYASTTVLKKEMQGSDVTALQKNLKKLGYLSTDITGYYGDATVKAVKYIQKEYGYDADGVAGSTTLALVDRVIGKSSGSKTRSDSKAANSSTASSSTALKEGVEGAKVKDLQKDLIKLGYLSTQATGYYGTATITAVKKLQKKYGYGSDGVTGSSTFSLIDKLTSGKSSSIVKTTTAKSNTTKTTTVKSTVKADKSGNHKTNYMLPWFNGVEDIFAVGDTATVYDIDSGLSFKVKRTYGHNHADSETLTAKDTATMKKIFGGDWTWSRKAIIVTVGGTKLAASMAGMPHAGEDQYATNKVVSSRSGGFGRGENLDAVKGNNMNGHFDIHFYGSRTHGTNRIDSAHQKMVKKAAAWAKVNL